MGERYPKDGDAKVYELAAKWMEKNNAIEAIRKEMRGIKDEIAGFASLKVGDVIREKNTGRKFAVDSVSVDEWYFRFSHGDKPDIYFSYEFRPFKKDETLSNNHKTICQDYPSDEYELTGERVEIKKPVI